MFLSASFSRGPNKKLWLLTVVIRRTSTAFVAVILLLAYSVRIARTSVSAVNSCDPGSCWRSFCRKRKRIRGFGAHIFTPVLHKCWFYGSLLILSTVFGAKSLRSVYFAVGVAAGARADPTVSCSLLIVSRTFFSTTAVGATRIWLKPVVENYLVFLSEAVGSLCLRRCCSFFLSVCPGLLRKSYRWIFVKLLGGVGLGTKQN